MKKTQTAETLRRTYQEKDKLEKGVKTLQLILNRSERINKSLLTLKRELERAISNGHIKTAKDVIKTLELQKT